MDFCMPKKIVPKKVIPKFGQEEFIQFVGLNDLTPEEQQAVKDMSIEGFDKLQRELKTLSTLVVHVKKYSETGERHKYSLDVRLNASTHVIESCKSHDWDLVRALHKAFDDVKHQIAHRFHSDSTRPRAALG